MDGETDNQLLLTNKALVAIKVAEQCVRGQILLENIHTGKWYGSCLNKPIMQNQAKECRIKIRENEK